MDGIIDSKDMNLSKLWETVKDREVWHDAVHGVTELDVTEQHPLHQMCCTHKSNKIFYDPPLKVMDIKAKINKWDLIKLKSFFTTKETISKLKRQPSEWEKRIANEATDN